MIKRCVQLLFLATVMWLIGFGYFVTYIQTQPHLNYTESDLKADGIVVLTGGNMRVAQGLVMLHEERGEELLISGVSIDIDLKKLLTAHSANTFMEGMLSDITLGYEAKNTRSNAIESYEWAQAKNYKSLIVVTAHYHMPRALLQFKNNMPHDAEYTLLSQPVIPEEFTAEDWWMDEKVIHLLVREYNKLLITYVVG